MATEAASIYPPLHKRSVKNTICLFDVDGTLTPARQVSKTKAYPFFLQIVYIYS